MELPAFIENTRTLLSVLTRYLDDYNPLSNLLGFWNVNTVNGKSRFKQYHNNEIKKTFMRTTNGLRLSKHERLISLQTYIHTYIHNPY